MRTHLDLTDNEFVSQFENLTLDPSLFSHEAHVRLAWVYLRVLPEEEVVERVCEGIQRFDQHFGDGSKFHRTLTVAAVKITSHFHTRSSSNTFAGFMAEFPRLIDDFKGLLFSHFTKERISDPEAKSVYLEPDIMAF